MLRWPLREILEAYTQEIKRDAIEHYRWAHLEYVVRQVNSSKRVELPELPEILRDRDG